MFIADSLRWNQSGRSRDRASKAARFQRAFHDFRQSGSGCLLAVRRLRSPCCNASSWMRRNGWIRKADPCAELLHVVAGAGSHAACDYSGWAVKGWRGGLLAGLFFVLPGAVVMLGLSALYIAFGHVEVVAGLLFGLKAAVLAVVFEALYRMAKRTLTSGFSYAVAIAAFIVIALLKTAVSACCAACSFGRRSAPYRAGQRGGNWKPPFSQSLPL
ncbi:chromate transporter domain-containing protein [Ditylenchus destructor]|nr:chromate transporter domain-containing protein [Ditylenchus destructor]